MTRAVKVERKRTTRRAARFIHSLLVIEPRDWDTKQVEINPLCIGAIAPGSCFLIQSTGRLERRSCQCPGTTPLGLSPVGLAFARPGATGAPVGQCSPMSPEAGCHRGSGLAPLNRTDQAGGQYCREYALGSRRPAVSDRVKRSLLGLAIVGALMAGCGTLTPSATPLVTSGLPTPSATPLVTSGLPTPMPLPSSTAPGLGWASLNCGRLDDATCLRVVTMVENYAPARFGPRPATSVVADYSCGPGEYCEAGFGALVVLIPAGKTSQADLAIFYISGPPNQPETVGPYPYAVSSRRSCLPLPRRTRTRVCLLPNPRPSSRPGSPA